MSIDCCNAIAIAASNCANSAAFSPAGRLGDLERPRARSASYTSNLVSARTGDGARECSRLGIGGDGDLRRCGGVGVSSSSKYFSPSWLAPVHGGLALSAVGDCVHEAGVGGTGVPELEVPRLRITGV